MASPERLNLPNVAGTDEEWWISVYLFENVKNMKKIQTEMRSGKLDVSLLDPKLIPSPEVLQVAALKSLLALSNEALVSYTVYSELVFNLNPTTSLREAYATFGPKQTKGSLPTLLLVQWHSSKLQHDDILKLVDGTLVPFNELARICDTTAVQKLYGIEELELKVSSLTDSVISRIAVRPARGD